VHILRQQEFRDFAESMGIKLLNSSPYYAQANDQAEAFNKIMIKIIQKKIDQKPKRWHSVLNEALWAYRMAPHGDTQTSPYGLVYGLLTVKIRQPSHEFTFGVGISFIPYPLVLTPVV
jgi:hypothetical protein